MLPIASVMVLMPSPLKILLALSLVAASTPGIADYYCCQDPGTGRRVCGDILPDQCKNISHRVLDSAGNLIREVGPPLTAEQKAELARENRRKKLLEDAAREKRRRDQALLDTYATPEDIDLAQKKAEGDVRIAIANAQGAIDAALQKRRKLEQEAEFYQKKAMPPDLEKSLRAIDHEIKLQTELQSLKQKEFDVIKTKYDTDRRRYFELTGRTSPGLLPPR